MSKKITTSQTLKEYVRSHINSALGEFENDDEEDDKLLLDDGDDVEKGPDDDDEDTMEQGDIETEDVIEKLNTIRSGRSFKDSSVKEELEQYVDELDIPEKTALFALLKGIAQIVTKEISADNATEPSDPQPGIEMKKKHYNGDNKKGSVRVKPTIIKKSTSHHDEKEDEEDTDAPVPISPIKR